MRLNAINRLLMGSWVALAAAGCNTSTPPASTSSAPADLAAAPAAPQVSVNAIMVALVDHAAHNLWEVEREGKAPQTDADWRNVMEHGVQIAAAAPAITAGGTGPSDAVWAKSESWRLHAQRMADAGAAAEKAAQGKNLQALIQANNQLVETCESCHKEFKPSLPTEGIAHAHAH